MREWHTHWENFKSTMPFKQLPYSKRNWGDDLHSLCSFYGKLKPSIAHHLISTFTNENDVVLDCFTGSGTVPFESALLGRKNFGLDINPIAVVLSKAKVLKQDMEGCQKIIIQLNEYIKTNELDPKYISKAESFGFNKTLKDYFHEATFYEILKARLFFQNYPNKDSNYYLVLGCLLHVLHGNRPYALSRNSHPITPYAPTGDFVYKSLISKLHAKVQKSLFSDKNGHFTEGAIFEQDIMKSWNDDIQGIDAIITSPPFFDSTRFYMTNWLRSWFLGWEKEDFDKEKVNFIDERQKQGLQIYKNIFSQAKERLNSNGIMLLHLGKSSKKDMGVSLSYHAKSYFEHIELFQENVEEIEKHGISDKGTVDTHQYLLLY
jgi:methylase of polypeptide subunit release factors